MALRRLDIDRDTASKLGTEVVDALRRDLCAVDCQSCGRPFGGYFDVPALGVDCFGPVARAGVYHRRCRTGRWRDFPGHVPREVPVTWKAVAFAVADPDTMPAFVVNPSCETVTLTRTPTGWRADDLLFYRQNGLTTDRSVEPGRVDRLVARLGSDRLAVGFHADGGEDVWTCPVDGSAEVFPRLWVWGEVLVAVTHALDPRRGGLPDLDRASKAGLVAFGVATVRFDWATQVLPGDWLGRDMRDPFFDILLAGADRDPANGGRGAAGADRDPANGGLDAAGADRDAAGADGAGGAVSAGGDVPARTGGDTGPVVAAAHAACDGDPAPLRTLAEPDRQLAVALVAAVYASHSATEARAGRTPAGEGAHVVLPAGSTAAGLASRWGAHLGGAFTIGSLEDRPDRAYRADIVLGTAASFARAAAAGPTVRGRVAILLDPDPATRELAFLRTYRRVIPAA